jgi:hypothetical protein
MVYAVGVVANNGSTPQPTRFLSLAGNEVRVSDHDDPELADPILAQVAALEKAESDLCIRNGRVTGIRLIGRY